MEQIIVEMLENNSLDKNSSQLNQEKNLKVEHIFDKYEVALNFVSLIKTTGKVVKIQGLLIICNGPICKIGDVCTIEKESGNISAEVIGFDKNLVQLMAYGDTNGIASGNKVTSTGECLKISLAHELCGRVLNAMGEPIDYSNFNFLNKKASIFRNPPDALKRKTINEIIYTGIKAIDSLLTLGKGQRIGIFSGTGVGKSTVLSMIARNTNADVNVIALVGERGREVREFIERDLGEEGLKRSVLVVATSDASAMERLRCLYTATTIAEYFRDKGKDVMLMVDSVTRLAIAQREIGISLGELPTVKGFPPSVFTMLPKILERSGTNDIGSITAIYSVLVEGDDMEDPIADAIRGILDGHIVLSRDLANKGHYPAIDIPMSISRLMPHLVDEESYFNASKIKEYISLYSSVEELIKVGAYIRGDNSNIDEAIDKIDAINNFLKQGIFEKCDLTSINQAIEEIVVKKEKSII